MLQQGGERSAKHTRGMVYVERDEAVGGSCTPEH
jgi:hypothetical protein